MATELKAAADLVSMDQWEQAWASTAGAYSALCLATLDLTDRPGLADGRRFSTTTWRACQGVHLRDEAYLRWADYLHLPNRVHRKFWEWAAILEAGRLGDVLQPGKRAIGFGVGTEPIAAALADHGLTVVATDLPPEDSESEHWTEGDQWADSVDKLSRPEVCDDAVLRERVSFRPIDMNQLPADLEPGTFDFVWSSCVVEHLGTPELGLDFMVNSARLLAPGGVMCHTTEYELMNKETTQDYGNCAVFRAQDFETLAERMRGEGFEVNVDLGVSLAAPEDRWISSVAVPGVSDPGFEEPAHLRLVIGSSVSTSFAVQVRRA